MKIMSDFRGVVWGIVPFGISQLDFDFRDCAARHFERLRHGMSDPGWQQRLQEA
jgi:hypothetical protein